MDMRIPPLRIKILLESNPLKSRILSTEIGRTFPRLGAGEGRRGHEGQGEACNRIEEGPRPSKRRGEGRKQKTHEYQTSKGYAVLPAACCSRPSRPPAEKCSCREASAASLCEQAASTRRACPRTLRPISLRRSSLLRFVDSNFPEISLWT